MARYRNCLPQVSDKPFLTDGGLETTMIFHQQIDLPEFAAFDLLSHPRGLQALVDYYDSYARVAHDNRLGFIFESVTWRAGPDWLTQIGYPSSALEQICQDSVDLLLPLREHYESEDTPMVISGQLGPRGDGYAIEQVMSTDEAQDYHTRQVNALAATEADMISALTLNYVGEAIGIVRAAKDAGMPSVMSFTVETDGCLPSGQPLHEAITEVDEATDASPAYYMVNCAHTTHFEHVLEDAPWIKRIRAIRANASCLSHAELDECTELDDGNPQSFGKEHLTLRERFPHINVLGGCCGTDIRHIRALAETALGEVA
jgi:S-methylmethionine-dependent homocysteine/selenocysteine methylase